MESTQKEIREQQEPQEPLFQQTPSLPTQDVVPRQTPHELIIAMIRQQKQKEIATDIWKNSPYKDLVKLQSNNVGNVGETFIHNLCNQCGIESIVDGSKTKQIGGGNGDGIIREKSVEIKTSHQGSSCPNFQHELGETPWKSNYMIFIDISPDCIYFTIFPNFDEEFYKSGKKCLPYFPTKAVTWRKGTGAFKLDTTVKINEENVDKGYTYKITETVNMDEVKKYIDKIIPIDAHTVSTTISTESTP